MASIPTGVQIYDLDNSAIDQQVSFVKPLCTENT